MSMHIRRKKEIEENYPKETALCFRTCLQDGSILGIECPFTPLMRRERKIGMKTGLRVKNVDKGFENTLRKLAVMIPRNGFMVAALL
ncbi:hypothetical protein TNIN_318301 [Trichonephila inaurata madagascariensis]|uniref:Uncharacterized protein n=1 Tax=Trichonephila inaurata madagascariensis TaxID=2747483 RepID=A0A8X6X541_9ARAC|nr:hypothetical protein TNIN_318301 [Trichonephila inaurata madagascariensis]